MSFLFDALKHLLASDPAARREGLAGLAGHVWKTPGTRLQHDGLPDGLEVWHYPKAGVRPHAATHTIGLADDAGRELLALTLGDGRAPTGDRVAGLLAAVAVAGPTLHDAAALPEGCLGRSSHTHAVLARPWPLPAVDLPEYERILGASLHLVIPVTAREAAWIAERGAASFVAAMQRQRVAPYADRAPGETSLD